jgi:TP53 regulating kinase and related kinases
MVEKIIAQAAEAIIIKEGSNIVKRRIKKSYRIPEIDEKLRKQRTRGEAKILQKASKIINVPRVDSVDEKTKEIKMQFLEGKKLSEHLDSLKNRNEIAEQIGQEIAKLHDSDIIHGDLTTSNMIYVEDASGDNNKTASASAPLSSIKRSPITKNISNPNNKVYFIDFGLGFISKRIEDKAVDLHLIRQALEAKHFSCWKSLFDFIIKGYNSKDKTAILAQLEKVEARGRYKKGF